MLPRPFHDAATFAGLVILATTLACNDTKNAPKGIDADGSVYIACKGFVTVSGNMQQGYEVRFTDAQGLDHDVRGIHKLEISDLPDKTLCGATDGKSDSQLHEDVNEACKQARASGNAMNWNEKEQRFEINPVCKQ